jgi:phenylalanyl-tRNA synthetase alpha subunit
MMGLMDFNFFRVAPGRVFRPDNVDATHMFMFHQNDVRYLSQF